MSDADEVRRILEERLIAAQGRPGHVCAGHPDLVGAVGILCRKVDGLSGEVSGMHEDLKTIKESVTTGQRSRSVELGPIKINGYAMSDVLKVAIFLAFLGCIWLFLNDRVERVKVLKELHITHQAMKTAANAGGTP